ncbi:MAG TPA: HNH endonuclease signature motif containing protein [Planctomycetaceae bacterium]|nr:HNH endonuclease signature motif containing protein [Planctomycetaceae bacterium]
MSRIGADLRRAVADRAAGRCEYCRLPDALQIGGFEVDHVIPRSAGGPTTLENLAWACPHCNAAKWAHADGLDPVTGETLALFNPRTDRWTDHFAWRSDEPYEIEGRTPIGRASIARLELNHPDLVTIRRLLDEFGVVWGSS